MTENDANLILIVDTSSGECLRNLTGHTSTITSLALLKNGHLAAGSGNGAIKIWNVKTGECIKTLKENDEGHTDRVSCLVSLNDGKI